MEDSEEAPREQKCQLKLLVEKNDFGSLQSRLYEHIWDRFSLEPSTCSGRSNSPWFLHAAVFTGCPILVNFALKQSNPLPEVGDSETVLAGSCSKNHYPDDGRNVAGVNVRIDCKFPLTDTWIHRSFKLSLSPLHLACWRLDYRSIKTLLAHGADPNLLALEESEFENCQIGLKLIESGMLDFLKTLEVGGQGQNTVHNQSGLCPLHFIALGIRASPKTSLFAGIQDNLMHDTLCPEVKECQDLSCSERQKETSISETFECILMAEKAQNSLCNDSTKNKSELCFGVVKCIEALLQAGARPDFCPPQKVLIGASPLDTVLQPPMRIFYAPNAARGNANPMALRRHDLVKTADFVIAACEILLQHGASVSESFSELYAWKPGVLDCFHLNNLEQAQQLVKYCIRLGLFSTSIVRPEEPLCPHFSALGTEFAIGFDPMIMRRFIADVINMDIPLCLASVVLEWCPFVLLRCAKKEISAYIANGKDKYAARMSLQDKWSRSGLTDLIEIVRNAQLASLRHMSALLILQTVGFKYQKVLSLPLPVPLKRGLLSLNL